MDWVAKQEKRLLKEFFEKTGIQITNEPIFLSEWEELNAPRLSMEAQEQPVSAIPKLEKAIKEHPELPSLKNYLFVAYNFADKTKKAFTFLERTIKEHPDYVFGINNKILNIREKEELLKVGHLLGEPRDIREIVGYDTVMHISAFKSYQDAAAHYEMTIGEDTAAVQRLESLMDLGVDQPFLDRMANNLAMVRIARRDDRLENRNRHKREVIAVQKVYLDQADVAPILNHPELNILYEVSTDSLSEEQQLSILALPRTTLIEDLETILVDTMKRWEYFQDTEYDKNTREFTYHALYFLGVLKSKASLQKVLDLFRMEEDFTDFWFSDYLKEVIFPTLYVLGEGQLNELQSFAIEGEISAFDKCYIGTVVGQVALHQPERRGEVIQWFQNVFQTFLDQPDNDKLIDTNFLTMIIGDVITFRGIELLPILEKLNEKNWIHDNFQGDIVEIRRLINEEDHPSELEPLPENIQEYYSRAYESRKIKRPLDEMDKAILEKFNSKGEQLITKFRSKNLYGELEDDDFEEEEENYYYRPAPVETIKRVGPKIGRNDPCTCGSGKKYKKCCLRKT